MNLVTNKKELFRLFELCLPKEPIVSKKSQDSEAYYVIFEVEGIYYASFSMYVEIDCFYTSTNLEELVLLMDKIFEYQDLQYKKHVIDLSEFLLENTDIKDRYYFRKVVKDVGSKIK